MHIKLLKQQNLFLQILKIYKSQTLSLNQNKFYYKWQRRVRSNIIKSGGDKKHANTGEIERTLKQLPKENTKLEKKNKINRRDNLQLGSKSGLGSTACCIS